MGIELKRSYAEIEKAVRTKSLQWYNIEKINSVGGFAFFASPETWEKQKGELIKMSKETPKWLS